MDTLKREGGLLRLYILCNLSNCSWDYTYQWLMAEFSAKLSWTNTSHSCLCVVSEHHVNRQVYLYDSSEVGRGEGGRVVIYVRDVYIDHHSGRHWWDSTIQSSDRQWVAGNLEGQIQWKIYKPWKKKNYHRHSVGDITHRFLKAWLVAWIFAIMAVSRARKSRFDQSSTACVDLKLDKQIATITLCLWGPYFLSNMRLRLCRLSR